MIYQTHSKTLPPETLADSFVQTLHPLIQSVLAGRGFDTVEKIYALLGGDLNHIVANAEMKDGDKAVVLIQQALERKDKIAIYRDYDCDGCSAASVAIESLIALGGVVTHYGNERSVDGYGICKRGIDFLMSCHPDLKMIITVDNGIVAYEAIEHAKSLGLTVIVTDHHEMGETLPVADAVVDPKRRDETCDFRDLCGAGVIFKLMIHLYKSMNLDLSPVLKTVDIVALATVADIMPLVGENRILVREGIRLMNEGNRPFFREVASQQGFQQYTAHSELGFQVGPLVNAPSRMGEAVHVVVDAMCGQEGSALQEQVAYLKRINDTRKESTNAAFQAAEDIAQKEGIDFETVPAIFLRCPDVADGLVGLVAGKLMNRYHKITAIFHPNQEGILKGSMRGIDGLHLKETLDAISKGVLLQYGGHAKAAGLSLKEEHFEQFKEEFMALILKAFPDGPPEEVVTVDAQVTESDCTIDLIDIFKQLQPYGEGFRPPVLELTMNLKATRYMGAEKSHVSYEGAGGLRAIRWHYGDREKASPTVDGVFYGSLEENRWNNRVTPQFICR